MNARTPIEEVFRTRGPELVRFAYHFTQNRADAQDLVQEALCRVMRMEGVRIEQLHSYLFKAVANLAIDRVRKIMTEARAMEAMDWTELDECSPQRILIGQENLQAAADVIENMPLKARTALVMLRFEGAGYEDVAAVFGIKVHSARRLEERARDYLKQSQVSP